MPPDENRPRLPPASVFVGREPELQRVDDALASATQGNGRVVLVTGDAGIGKTRLLDEIVNRARHRGMVVLRGQCAEDSTGNSYAPFRGALDGYVAEVAEATLRSQLGPGAGVIAQLVPRVRRLADIGEPVRLQPNEERIRLLDAVSQFLIAIAARAPLVLALVDLYWADDDTLTLFRHVGRHLMAHRMILLGAYREHEVEDEGALAQAVAVLRRQPGFERITLAGFADPEVETFLQNLAEQRSTAWSAGPVDAALTKAIGAETKGNPFFVGSLMLHLEEEGRLRVEEGCWRTLGPLEEVALPEGVREVLRRRIGRLTPEAQSFLTVGAAVGGTFRFDIVVAVSALSEQQGLAAVDEALQAQLIESAPALDSYAFGHALVRQTLYEAMNPSRRVRLHRRIAETMETVYGDRASEHAAEIATHYHRSRTLPGAERGVAHALLAADKAQGSVAFAEVATDLRIALDLLPSHDPRRPRLHGRLGLALAWVLSFEDAVRVAGEAGRLLAEAEGTAAAAEYLSKATLSLGVAGSLVSALGVAQQGIQYIGERRDLTWLRLASYDLLRREQEDPDYPGIPVDGPERREMAALWPLLRGESASRVLPTALLLFPIASRDAVLRERAGDPVYRLFWAGDLRGALSAMEEVATQAEREGRISGASICFTLAARCRLALGEIAAADAAYARAAALGARLPESSIAHGFLLYPPFDRCMAVDDGWSDLLVSTGKGAKAPSSLSDLG